jgi:hypothetical protein
LYRYLLAVRVLVEVQAWHRFHCSCIEARQKCQQQAEICTIYNLLALKSSEWKPLPGLQRAAQLQEKKRACHSSSAVKCCTNCLSGMLHTLRPSISLPYRSHLVQGSFSHCGHGQNRAVHSCFTLLRMCLDSAAVDTQWLQEANCHSPTHIPLSCTHASPVAKLQGRSRARTRNVTRHKKGGKKPNREPRHFRQGHRPQHSPRGGTEGDNSEQHGTVEAALQATKIS